MQATTYAVCRGAGEAANCSVQARQWWQMDGSWAGHTGAACAGGAVAVHAAGQLRCMLALLGAQ
jgi:hypothetical protein